MRRLAALNIIGQASRGRGDIGCLHGRPAQGWRLCAQPSQGYVDITTLTGEDAACL